MSETPLLLTPCESVVPLRAVPSETAEMVSQLLWGETALALAREGSWVRLRCTHDGYEGWADAQMVTGQAAVSGGVNLHSSLIITEIALPMGVRVPDAPLLSPTPESLMATARLFLGTPYLWGGRTSWGIDCSGLMQTVFAAHGLSLPRDASVQAREGLPVEIADIRPGDLVFFAKPEKTNITHVGLAATGHGIIHASGRVRTDLLRDGWLWRAQTTTATHRVVCARRLPGVL